LQKIQKIQLSKVEGQGYKHQSGVFKPLMLAIFSMVCLFLAVLSLQFSLVSSQSLLWLFWGISLVSVVLVFVLMAFLKTYRELQVRIDLSSSGTDVITGLPDPHEFAVRVDVECRRCTREFTPLSLMYVGFDIEELEEQDAIKVAQNLVHAVSRPGDMVAKVDATTFGLILPSSNELVLQLADRCLKGVQQLEIPHPVSIGVRTFQPTSELSCDAAMASVQQLLINAKTHGGNQVCADTEQLVNPSVTYSY
jgi:GGDEF domain-containing protein